MLSPASFLNLPTPARMLVLVAIHLFHPAAGPTAEARDRFTWSVTHHTKTGSDHRLRSVHVMVQNGGISYHQSEQIRGSTDPRVVQEAFKNELKLDPELESEFFDRLQAAGIADIPATQRPEPAAAGDPPAERDPWSYSVSATISGTWWGAAYSRGLPAGVEPVKALVDEFITRLELDVPPLPHEVSIRFEDPNLSIRLRTDQPLWNPWAHVGRTIAGIEQLPDDLILIRWQDDAHPALRGELTGRSHSLERFEGQRVRSCVTRRTRTASEGDHQPSREVTLAEVLDDPDAFHGKRIMVAGHYRVEFESSSLSVTQEASEERDYARSVWLGGSSTFAKAENITFRAGLNPLDAPPTPVVVEGVFFKGRGGHMGLWPGEIRRLTVFRNE